MAAKAPDPGMEARVLTQFMQLRQEIDHLSRAVEKLATETPSGEHIAGMAHGAVATSMAAFNDIKTQVVETCNQAVAKCQTVYDALMAKEDARDERLFEVMKQVALSQDRTLALLEALKPRDRVGTVDLPSGTVTMTIKNIQ